MLPGRAMDLAVSLVDILWLEVTGGFSISPLSPTGKSLLDVETE